MSPAEAQELISFHGSARAAARAIGKHHSVVARAARGGRGKKAKLSRPAIKSISIPKLPAKDIPVEEIIEAKIRELDHASARKRAERWMPISINETKPFGVLCVGDTHVDGKCDWRLLNEHADIAKRAGVYSIFVGDAANQWPSGGRMGGLWAEQNTGRSRAHKLVDHFFNHMGFRWLLMILGNHDRMGDNSQHLLEILNRTGAYMADWDARVLLKSGKLQKRLHVAHSLPGSSLHNPLHHHYRAARFATHADIYVTGHKHTYASGQFTIPGQDRVVTAAMCGTYKRLDPYALHNGFEEEITGSSVLIIIDPRETLPQRQVLPPFPEPDIGYRVLEKMRGGL